MIAQTKAQVDTIGVIEYLRRQKEDLKITRDVINAQIIQIDIQIRDLRQSLPKITEPEKPVKTQKPKETLIQKHNRLMREIADAEIKLGIRQEIVAVEEDCFY